MEREATEQLHLELTDWIGVETPPLVEIQALIWALAQDRDLHDRFNAMVKFEREQFESTL